MENFFVDDRFYSSIEELVEDVLYYEDIDNLRDLREGWQLTVELSSFQKVVQFTKKDIEWLVAQKLEEEDRIYEADDVTEAEIVNAFDLQSINKRCPSLYYPNQVFQVLTKADLITKTTKQ